MDHEVKKEEQMTTSSGDEKGELEDSGCRRIFRDGILDLRNVRPPFAQTGILVFFFLFLESLS
jgi:hypothetical protein